MEKYSTRIAVLLLIICVSVLILPSIRDVEFAEKADEGYYLRYADEISTHGLTEFRNLFTQYIENKSHWFFPNPLRIGFFLVASAWINIFDKSFFALSYLSFLCYLLFIITNFHFCRKHFGEEKAIFLSLLIAFSPLNMGMSRRALADSAVTLFLALSMWLFLEMLREDKNFKKKGAFLLIFSFSILMKETCALLIAPFLIFIIAYDINTEGKIKSQNIIFTIFPLVIAFLVYIILSGSLGKTIEVIKIILQSPGSNEYALRYGAGPWFRYIIDFMLLSPCTLILSIGYIFCIAKNWDLINWNKLFFLTILLVLFCILNFFTKNLRYVMILDMPIRLFSIFMIYRLIPEKVNDNLRRIALATIILLICVTDYFTYKNIFVINSVYDPVSIWLLGYRNIIFLE